MRLAVIMLAAGLPWIAATLWLAWKVGWSILWSRPDGKAFPNQAHQLRSFGGGR